MRRLVLAMLVFACGCSTDAAPSSGTIAMANSTTTAAAPATTTRVTTTTAMVTTSTATHGASAVVPAGYAVEDFVPLVENYFAVRNWALEHPDEVTEHLLATVIEPGSAEMQFTLSEIQDLLDQDAHYEGLSETFELLQVFPIAETSNLFEGVNSVGTTIEYGNTALVYGNGAFEGDGLRRAGWTLRFTRQETDTWLVAASLRNLFDHKPSSP